LAPELHLDAGPGCAPPDHLVGIARCIGWSVNIPVLPAARAEEGGLAVIADAGRGAEPA
jgi:hypothetical protein